MSSFAGAGNGKDKDGKKPVRSGLTPKVTDSRCKICSMPEYRGYVDRMLVAGVTLREIADFLTNALGEDVHYSAVQRHKKNHLDLKQRTIRRILEKRIKGDIDDLDAAVGDLIDRKSMMEAVAHDGFTQIMDQKVRYTIGEWLAVMDKIDQQDREEKMESVTEMKRELIALVTAVKQLLSPAQFDQLMVLYGQQLGERPLAIASTDEDIAAELETAVEAEWTEE